jgi:hypothetical protein
LVLIINELNNMAITKQQIVDKYNQIYSADNGVDKTFVQLTKDEKVEALLAINSESAGSGGGTYTVDFGTKINAATMPTGGSSNLGWLSGIYQSLVDRIPALSNGKIPVEVGSLNVTLDNATLEIANDVGNPIPVFGTVTANLGTIAGVATANNQATANISLASIDTKTPVLGQALAASSTPVVLTASQLSTLTPLASVGITGTLPTFASTPTFNIGTISTIATETTLDLLNTKVPSNLTVTSTRLLVDGSGVTQPTSLTALPSLAAGTNFIGRLGQRGFKVAANFTRPADTTAYTAKDAITNSTSAPTVMAFDLAAFGASNAGLYAITNARVISSAAPSNLLVANIVIFNSTFAATNDNSQLSIDDVTAQTGGIVIPCLNTHDFLLNSRCVSDPGLWVGQLGDASTILYFTIQAAAGYTPVSGERFDIVLEGYLL